MLKLTGKLVAEKLRSSGRRGFSLAQDLAWCTNVALWTEGFADPWSMGLLPGANVSLSRELCRFVLLVASTLCCWIELAQKNMTLRGAF